MVEGSLGSFQPIKLGPSPQKWMGQGRDVVLASHGTMEQEKISVVCVEVDSQDQTR